MGAPLIHVWEPREHVHPYRKWHLVFSSSTVLVAQPATDSMRLIKDGSHPLSLCIGKEQIECDFGNGQIVRPAGAYPAD